MKRLVRILFIISVIYVLIGVSLIALNHFSVSLEVFPTKAPSYSDPECHKPDLTVKEGANPNCSPPPMYIGYTFLSLPQWLLGYQEYTKADSLQYLPIDLGGVIAANIIGAVWLARNKRKSGKKSS